MKMTLDHVFILVEPEAKVADLLLEQDFFSNATRQENSQ